MMRRLLSGSSGPSKEQRKEVRDAVRGVLNSLIEESGPYLELSDSRDLQVEVYPLEFDASGNYDPDPRPCYFRPWATEKLSEYPINQHPDPAVCRTNSRSAPYAYPGTAPEQPNKRLRARFHIEKAMEIEGYLLWELKFAPRMKTRDSCQPLSSLSQWRSGQLRDNILDREMLSLLARKSQRGLPYQSFTSNDDSQPHVMLTFSHDIKGDDDRLLRGELLAILATMKTRLSTSRLKDHLVIPVMMFSFMGPDQARVLQAYFDGQKLILHKTKLYSFTDKSKAPIDLFLCLLMNVPVGDTKVLPASPMDKDGTRVSASRKRNVLTKWFS